MRQHFCNGYNRAGRGKPPEKKVVTGYGHANCGGAIVQTTNTYGTTYGCAKCGKPTTAVGGNLPSRPASDEPF
jgi:hypothetical protein